MCNSGHVIINSVVAMVMIGSDHRRVCKIVETRIIAQCWLVAFCSVLCVLITVTVYLSFIINLNFAVKPKIAVELDHLCLYIFA